MIVLLTLYYFGEGGGKGVASDTYRGDEKCVQRLFGRSWLEVCDAIKMDLKEIERGFMNFIHIAQDRGT